MISHEEANKLARRVVEACLEEVIIDVPMNDSSTFRELGLDSLDSVELTMLIEDELNIYLEDTDIGISIDTVGAVIDHVTKELIRQQK